ncbi:hypothetical protein DVF79_24080, partial [Salmonella enterica subsp. enterica serovar Plymouth]|nr:hypothetical protein [Salmonella enterica subsp. enterica serovar Plymouth]
KDRKLHSLDWHCLQGEGHQFASVSRKRLLPYSPLKFLVTQIDNFQTPHLNQIETHAISI